MAELQSDGRFVWSVAMKERPGDPKCDHSWVYDDLVICTNPPTMHKICSRCGKVEHESGEVTEPSYFGSILERFHEKEK